MKLQLLQSGQFNNSEIEYRKIGDSYVVVCGDNEILTLTRTCNDLIDAYAVEDKYWPVADEINRANFSFSKFAMARAMVSSATNDIQM